MGGHIWQYIFMVTYLVYQVKGFEPDDLEPHPGGKFKFSSVWQWLMKGQ